VKLLLAVFLLASALAAPPPVPANTRVPVLLELFTSEGCSSCPPADRLLESLDRQTLANADPIVLSEHVDYWNYLGWKDPYSSPLFSQRQHDYSTRLGAEVYTPQMVIDGQFQALGSDQREVTQVIARAAQKTKLPVSIRATSGVAHVEANSGGVNADLYLIVASDRAVSKVLRGENGGHMLTHVAVARSITRIGKWEGAARDLPLPAESKKEALQPGETRVIAILQDPQTGRILGAAQTRF
jgi:hypothetical protein